MRPPYPSEFGRRMTNQPRPERDEETAKAWVAAFIASLCDLEGHHEPIEASAPRQLLTAEEVRNLGYLRWRVERGEVTA